VTRNSHDALDFLLIMILEWDSNANLKPLIIQGDYFAANFSQDYR
jgi:hypothetical protein